MKGLLRSLSRNPARQDVIKQAIRVKNVPLVATGAAGVGWATAVVGDFPQGNILLLGAVAYLQFSKNTVAGAAGVQDTFDGDYSLGTTPTADNALAGTEANIVPSTPLGAATAGVSPVVRGASTTPPGMLDNTDDSLEINVNLLIDDANISADAQNLLVSGVIYVSYVVLGDD